jgi:hypothetical protein
VLAFASEAGRAYLLLAELPGTPVELAFFRLLDELF